MGPADDLSALVAEWLRAATSAEVDRTIRQLITEVAEETRKQRPLCVASGRCCQFESFGHRLYLTGLEAAWTWLQLERRPSAQDVARSLDGGHCPFLVTGLCGVHLIRPLGCRMFFCDVKAASWQSALYERVHRAVQDLHERQRIPYRYAEWRSLLGALAAAVALQPDGNPISPKPPD